MPDPILEAQSYHMLRVADLAAELVGYARRPGDQRNPRALASVIDVKAEQKHLAVGKAGEAFLSELKAIRGLVGSLGALTEDRNIFWHAPDRSRTWAEGKQSWENIVGGISDEKFANFRKRIAEAIEKTEHLKYGDRPLTGKELGKLGIDKTIETLHLLDAQLEKVERLRAPGVSPQVVENSAGLYRRSVEVRGTTIPERFDLAHTFHEDGTLRREPHLTRPTQPIRSPEPHSPPQHRIPPQAHTPRAPGVVAGSVMAVTAGVGALMVSATPAQAAHAVGEHVISYVPGIGGRLAPNRHEAAVRDAVDAWGLAVSAAGAYVGGGALGTAGTVVPVAGNAGGVVVGVAGGGILGNLIGSMAGNELLRLHARYVLGQKDTVEPSAGEQVIAAAIRGHIIAAEQLTSVLDSAMRAGGMKGILPDKTIDQQLTDRLAAMNEKGWGKALGDKDGKLTLEELKAAFPKGFDFKTIDKDGNGISGKEITDALAALKNAGVQTAPAPSTPDVSPTRVAVAPTVNSPVQR